MKKMISICVPCFNEQDNVIPLYTKVTEEMKKIPRYDYEIVFRDNASTDDTYERLKVIAKKDYRVKIIENMANYGPGKRGFTFGNYVSGDIVIFIAADLQDPVELIHEFIEYYDQGFEIVFGQKTSSEEGISKYFLRHLFYKIINFFSERKQYEHTSGITLLSKRMYELLVSFGWQLPLRYLVAELGVPVKLVPYRQLNRKHGKSHMTLDSLLDFAIKSLIWTSTKPLRYMTIMGVSCSTICVLIGVVYFVMKLIYWNTFQLGIAPLVIGVFLIGSLQFLFLGLLGEYLAVVMERVSKLPPSVVKEVINIDLDVK